MRTVISLSARRPGLCLFLPLLSGVLPASAALDYERDIMPIFASKCFDCHSAKSEKMKGGLRLDDPKHLHRRFGKNDVVVPGDWDASYLFVVITRSQDHKEAMPPRDKGEPLSAEEILKVATWIHEGARIDGERGEKGRHDNKPEDHLRFKDGRLVTEAFEPSPEPEAVLREWINRDGKKIMAVLKGVESRHAVFVLEDGRIFRYPLEKLSDGSRARIRELAGTDGRPPG